MRRNKYGNIKVEIDGHKFDSQKEAWRYGELKMLERAGKISNLQLHPKFKIMDSVLWNGKTLQTRFYSADFMYCERGQTVVEDVKSAITKKNPVYTLKKQLFLIQNPEYEFREV